jgi:hypothetical protein
MSSRFRAALVLAVAGALSVSCGGIVDPSKNKMDPFSGTIQVGGNASFNFSTGSSGEVYAKIATLSPSSSAPIGLAFAQSDGTSCSANVLWNQVTQPGIAVTIPTQVPSGRYCVVLYDAGYFSVAQTYTGSVSHP